MHQLHPPQNRTAFNIAEPWPESSIASLTASGGTAVCSGDDINSNTTRMRPKTTRSKWQTSNLKTISRSSPSTTLTIELSA
ncbi:hypothetical protein CCHR01_17396 [Colletotrichum chrysophilum]|uniref:Uncharacterized protein n=1 Tax=Colletotrichum chrysophilum TaxID=1836956 RepID=A0AAD9A2K8_9PEZI|nr:hypothetical protein CCHR01_17396 [Colletotrichum chrysophilum]